MGRPTRYDRIDVLMSTGEGDPLDGGGFIFEHSGELLWQFWDAPKGGKYLVYTAPLPENVLEYYNFVSVERLSAETDYEVSELEDLGASDSVDDRSLLLEIICDVHGGDSIDITGEPEELSKAKLKARWSDHIDDDDEEEDEGMDEEEDSPDFVILQDGPDWVVTRTSGEVIETFEGHESALIFIAKEMVEGEPGDLYWRNEKGKLELVEGFDPEMFLREGPRRTRASGKKRRPRRGSVGKSRRQSRRQPKGRSARRRRAPVHRRAAGMSHSEFRETALRVRENIVEMFDDLYAPKEDEE